MNAMQRLAARSRLARAVLFAVLFPVLFPYYFTIAFIRTFPKTALKPFGLTAEHGKISIGWREVLPLDEMAAVLDQRRAELGIAGRRVIPQRGRLRVADYNRRVPDALQYMAMLKAEEDKDNPAA